MRLIQTELHGIIEAAWHGSCEAVLNGSIDTVKFAWIFYNFVSIMVEVFLLVIYDVIKS